MERSFKPAGSHIQIRFPEDVLGDSGFFSYNLAMSSGNSWKAHRLTFNLVQPFGLAASLFLACIGIPAAADSEALVSSDALAVSNYRLYPNISQAQSDLAHEGLKLGYGGDFSAAVALYRQMEKLESRDSLAPLSQLMQVATGVLILERGDYADKEDAARIEKAVLEAADQGRYLCKQGLNRFKNHPTFTLILGGIQGFVATRKIHLHPTRALQDGFQAMRLLEKTLSHDPRMKDAYMGQGIFDCTASSAPLVVRGTMKLLGRSSNFKNGLRSLRVSAYAGQYTSVASQFYLIQFLSPYEVESREEKGVIFQSLQEAFPGNPMYPFLENDESLCFFPDSFFSKRHSKAEAALKRLKPFGYAGSRYMELLKMQISLLSPDSTWESNPSDLPLREWAFYPIFIEGLRHKREFEDSLRTRDPAIVPEEWMQVYRDSTLALIAQSDFTPTAKRYHSWRIRDAFKLRRKAASAYANPSPGN
jgi:hypothetical protein